MKLHIRILKGIATALVLMLLSLFACSLRDDSPGSLKGYAFPGADKLFHRDPRWLGSDGATSVRLSPGRILWLFADTFVATSDRHVRPESKMVRNTVAIQTGKDPRTAAITFHWRKSFDGSPTSYFPERGNHWYWPGAGIRLDKGPLVIFLYAIVETPGRGLGFATKSYALAVINNPDSSPEAWSPRIVDITPSPFDAIPATALIREGGYVVAIAIRQEGTHAGALVRYPVSSLSQGDATKAEWWAGESAGWVPSSSLGEHGPVFVLDDAGSECSINWNPLTRSYIHVASYGFGASTIGVRTAPALIGPWSPPQYVYRPPESDGPHPFVYAAKAHPNLVGPKAGDLVVTYATNSFKLRDLLTPEGMKSLYWPRIIVLRYRE